MPEPIVEKRDKLLYSSLPIIDLLYSIKGIGSQLLVRGETLLLEKDTIRTKERRACICLRNIECFVSFKVEKAKSREG